MVSAQGNQLEPLMGDARAGGKGRCVYQRLRIQEQKFHHGRVSTQAKIEKAIYELNDFPQHYIPMSHTPSNHITKSHTNKSGLFKFDFDFNCHTHLSKESPIHHDHRVVIVRPINAIVEIISMHVYMQPFENEREKNIT